MNKVQAQLHILHKCAFKKNMCEIKNTIAKTSPFLKTSATVHSSAVIWLRSRKDSKLSPD